MKNLIFLLLLMLLVSCKKENGQINVVYPDELELGARVHQLKISSQDTVIPLIRGKHSVFFSKGDTLTLSGLTSGSYTLSYLDLLGKTKTEKIILKDGGTVFIAPKPLAVDVKAFNNKTPISNIKEGKQYTVVKTQTASQNYTVYKIGGQFYIEPYAQKKKLINAKEMEAINKFEAELLAVQDVDICYSTGSAYYSIIKETDTLRIDDNTCMWNGWENLMHKLYEE